MQLGGCSWLVVWGCILLVVGSSALDDGEDDREVGENEIVEGSADGYWFQIDDEDGELTVPQLIAKYGYKVESHAVISEDGYMLTVFRILPRQQPPPDTKKYPVLLVHGLLTSAADYVITGPNNSLAYLLADQGYDVWLANMRGTRYSRGHTSLTVDSEEYWDFSWHEMGYYDLPAMIDYISTTSGSAKVHYVGHSQGTTVYFVMSSSRPEYNAKIALMTALSPAVIMKRIRSPIFRVLIDVVESLKPVFKSLGIYEVFTYNRNYFELAKSFCPKEERNNLCYRLIAQLAGPHPEVYDRRLGLAFLGHNPAGASIKQLLHFIQLIRSGRFRWYDYGRKGNLQTYSNWRPPTYNLTASTAPVLIYYALNDWIVHPRDVQQFAKMLPRVVAADPVADKKFNHIDFITATNAREQLYDKLVPVLDAHNAGGE